MNTLNGLNSFELFQFYCKTNKKYGLYYYYDLDITPAIEYNIDELYLAAPWIKKLPDSIRFDNSGFLIFDSEDELNEIYNNTVGDDGPTLLNKYNGNIKVYLLTFDKNGTMLNENT